MPRGGRPKLLTLEVLLGRLDLEDEVSKAKVERWHKLDKHISQYIAEYETGPSLWYYHSPFDEDESGRPLVHGMTRAPTQFEALCDVQEYLCTLAPYYRNQLPDELTIFAEGYYDGFGRLKFGEGHVFYYRRHPADGTFARSAAFR